MGGWFKRLCILLVNIKEHMFTISAINTTSSWVACIDVCLMCVFIVVKGRAVRKKSALEFGTFNKICIYFHGICQKRYGDLNTYFAYMNGWVRVKNMLVNTVSQTLCAYILHVFQYHFGY